MKTLVIAEKPSVGRDIGRVLHCQNKGNGRILCFYRREAERGAASQGQENTASVKKA